MPTDLTGSNISDIYTSLLHISGSTLSAAVTPIYDGKGNKSTLSLSTSSVSISNLNVNGVTYPTAVGSAQGVVVSDGVSKFTVSSLASVLSNINTTIPTNGVYSSPVVTIENSLVSSIVSSIGNKTFFYPTRVSTESGPSKEQLLSVVSWNSPVTNDKAIVLQKVLNSDGSINNLSINVFTRTATDWSGPVTY